jgi:pimeloyl-ACP methyl ester carboxylesterase
MQTKPSIVFCHGIWADGTSFGKVIPPLQAEGYEVMAAQYGLDTPEGDVATVKRTLGRVGSPAILVGHSYGGSVIKAAGTDGMHPASPGSQSRVATSSPPRTVQFSPISSASWPSA